MNMDAQEKLMTYAWLVWIAALAVFAITVAYIMYAETAPFAILVSHVSSDASATSFTIQLVFRNQNDSAWITSIKLNSFGSVDRTAEPILMIADDTLQIVVPGNQTTTLHFHLLAQSFDKKHTYSVPFDVNPRNGIKP